MNQLPLPLVLPDFIYTEPTLASGGGAEVVSLANRAWFTNNGFSADVSLLSSSLAPLPPYAPLSLSDSLPFGFDLSPDHDHSHPPTAPITVPDRDLSILRRHIPPSLPVYSASGFDLLAILARVATRPNPHVVLGSVDLKCAFVVVDTRRFDHPIVYCSPSFCDLTGYTEVEIIGRNCRFLQAPTGHVPKGEPRKHTSHDAVAHLRKSLVANKECQTSIRNFRKDGSAFMNLLTVIPLPGGVSGDEDEDDYVYHVGFQVDLAQKPNAILDRLDHGSYLVNYSPSPPTRDRRPINLPPVVMSKQLKNLIADPAFIKSIPLSTSTALSSSSSSPNQDDLQVVSTPINHLLHLLLLEASPDFIHVVSLKGSFLYVAPSVRRVLGYEPEHMVGKAISDFAHPKDVVPLMRELKESSAIGGPTEDRPSSASSSSSSSPPSPRTVSLLFRARTKIGNYVWVESRGRLHIEPGKGKKAIVLSGRARHMSTLSFHDLRLAGGIARCLQARVSDKKSFALAESGRLVEQEVWGMISGYRKETMTFLSVGQGVEDVLGWTADELIGQNVMDIVLDEGARSNLGSVVANMKFHQHVSRPGQSSVDGSAVQKVPCALRKKGSGVAKVWFIIYRNQVPGSEMVSSTSTVPLVYQIRLVGAQTILSELASKPNAATQFSDDSSQLSSSSLAGAVPILNFSSSSASPPFSVQPTTATTTTLDMFEELAISKGSSWQYELQQLRFANVRLREELAGLRVAFGDSTVGNNQGEAAGDDTWDLDSDVQVYASSSSSSTQHQEMYSDNRHGGSYDVSRQFQPTLTGIFNQPSSSVHMQAPASPHEMIIVRRQRNSNQWN